MQAYVYVPLLIAGFSLGFSLTIVTGIMPYATGRPVPSEQVADRIQRLNIAARALAITGILSLGFAAPQIFALLARA